MPRGRPRRTDIPTAEVTASLARNGGSVRAAARDLGLPRSTVARHADRAGVERQRRERGLSGSHERPGEDGPLRIENLAAALEEAARVDELRFVHDPELAARLYERRKSAALAAAKAAGVVVARATQQLARLHAAQRRRGGA